MVKQPKYFVSTSRPTRSVEPVTNSSEPSLVSVATDEKRAPTRLQFKRIPTAILGLGLTTLAALCIMVAVSTGLVKASFFQSGLPMIFDHSVPVNTVIAQDHAGVGQGINFDIQTADARVEIIRSFLERYKSPLTPYDHYATALVAASDRYGLDYRLLPAIMMQESNLCKSSDPQLHNCLGFGIHERGTLGFDSYEDSFDRAARELKANYIDQGLTTPEEIMKKYTPSSNGSWANSVNQWIAEMEHNDREAGKTASSDANLLEYTASR